MTPEQKDRRKLKVSLIFSICFAVVIMATIILPNMMDLNGEPGKMYFEGNPVYFCDEPFEISSCHNKTSLKNGVFSNGGHNFMEVDMFDLENMTLAEKSGFNLAKEITAWESLDIIESASSNERLNMTVDPTLNMTMIP